MLKQKGFVFLALLLLMRVVHNQTEIAQKRDENCDGVDLNEGNLTEKEMEDLRDERDNPFYEDYVDVFRYIESGDAQDIIDSFLWEFILIIILLSLVFISIIIFLIFCCGACKKKDGEEGAGKSCVTIGCILFWLVVMLFIVFFVFMILASKEIDATICQLHNTSVMILDGSKNTNWEFYGIRNFYNLLEAFQNSLNDISGLYGSFNSIFLSKIQDKTNKASQSLYDFSKKYKNSQTPNGNGVLEYPISITNLIPGVSYQIQADFVNIDLVAQKITDSAIIGRQLGSPVTRALFDANIQIIKTNLKTKVDDVEISINDLLSNFDDNDK